jgi:diadenosine tetraphosphate (Ap4A) HIT family hydrolase
MTKSVFTKMLEGDIPAEIIYQDDSCFVVPTIAPHTEGHIMVITTEQIENWEDLNAQTYQEVMQIVKKIGKLTKSIYSCPKVGVSIVGFEVSHVHVHIIPLYKISDMDHTSAKQVEFDQLGLVAEKYRAEITAQGGLK